MGSRNNRRRKVQPQPDWCYSKKPGREDVQPCEHGPAIGQGPFVLLKIEDTRGPSQKTWLITGRLHQLGPGANYAGALTGPDSSHWDCNFNFGCDDQVWNWEADANSPGWPTGPWTADLINRYTGPKQFDTGWHIAYPPSGATGLSAVYRVYL